MRKKVIIGLRRLSDTNEWKVTWIDVDAYTGKLVGLNEDKSGYYSDLDDASRSLVSTVREAQEMGYEVELTKGALKQFRIE